MTYMKGTGKDSQGQAVHILFRESPFQPLMRIVGDTTLTSIIERDNVTLNDYAEVIEFICAVSKLNSRGNVAQSSVIATGLEAMKLGLILKECYARGVEGISKVNATFTAGVKSNNRVNSVMLINNALVGLTQLLSFDQAKLEIRPT